MAIAAKAPMPSGRRVSETKFLGYSLFIPGTAHSRAGCTRVAIVIWLAQLVSVYLVNRGYRAAKVAFVTLIALWFFDLVGGWLVIRAFNNTGETEHLNTVRRGMGLVILAVALGFVFERALPPIPPAAVIEAAQKLAERLSLKKPEERCDPRLETCVKSDPPPWIDRGNW